MRRIALAALLAASLAGSLPAAADGFSASFVGAFNAACVPERLSYEGTVARAKAEGWAAVDPASHAEFAAVMKKSAEGVEEAKADGIAMDFRSEALAKTVDDRPLHLVVSFAQSEYLDEIGCYLYDFAATEPIAREAVTALIGAPPSQVTDDAAIVNAVWGPPEGMVRTLDTYLTFIPPGSQHAATTGLDGVVLHFSTSAAEEE